MKLGKRYPHRHGEEPEEVKKLKRSIYSELVAIPLLLIVSLIFFLIATMDGKIFGTPDDELDLLINEKLKDIMAEIDKNDAKGGNNNDLMVGDSFDKIKLALKLYPSMDNEDFIMQ